MRILKNKYNFFDHNTCISSNSCMHPFNNPASNNRDCKCSDQTPYYKFLCGEEKNVYYSGWTAALRAYNGWACNGGDLDYVEKISKISEGVLSYNSIEKDVVPA